MAALSPLAPVLGVLADSIAVKKAAGSFPLYRCAGHSRHVLHSYGRLATRLVLFVIVELSVAARSLYDSLLPHIAKQDEIDRVSRPVTRSATWVAASSLALNLAWIKFPQWFGLPHGADLAEAQATLPSRLAFLSVALWWVVFSLPLFLEIREPSVRGEAIADFGKRSMNSLLQPW